MDVLIFIISSMRLPFESVRLNTSISFYSTFNCHKIKTVRFFKCHKPKRKERVGKEATIKL